MYKTVEMDQPPPSKRIKTEIKTEASLALGEENLTGLLSLSDEILLDIFANCDSAALDALSG